jgi:toxin ParE1/3/4
MTHKRLSTRSVEPAVEWKETARTDLLAIIDYISDDNPDAAKGLRTISKQKHSP